MVIEFSDMCSRLNTIIATRDSRAPLALCNNGTHTAIIEINQMLRERLSDRFYILDPLGLQSTDYSQKIIWCKNALK
jgi:hypothetical protein